MNTFFVKYLSHKTKGSHWTSIVIVAVSRGLTVNVCVRVGMNELNYEINYEIKK